MLEAEVKNMASDIEKLGGVAIGLLMLVVVFAVVPMVGSQIDNATPDLANDSMWNPEYNTDLATGADLWADTSGMISLAAILVIVGVVIGAVVKFKGGMD